MNSDSKLKVKEYAQSLSNEDLEMLTLRLTQKLQGDLSEALIYMSQNKSMDEIFFTAKSAEELFDTCEQVSYILQQECKKKGLVTAA